jgi:hypothetical protein
VYQLKLISLAEVSKIAVQTFFLNRAELFEQLFPKELKCSNSSRSGTDLFKLISSNLICAKQLV